MLLVASLQDILMSAGLWNHSTGVEDAHCTGIGTCTEKELHGPFG